VSAAQLAAIVDLIGEGTISARSQRTCSRSSGRKAATRASWSKARGMKQVTDLGAIEKVVDDIIAANPDKVAQAKAKPQLAAGSSAR
jgi:aspartyl-tRNA(Asn)/glutamyl-tRNA(Gln) amidotransferase subunit B